MDDVRNPASCCRNGARHHADIGLAYLGPIRQENIFYATGYSGNGLTYAVNAAHLFKDYVLGRDNPLQKIYAANRPFHLSAHIKGAQKYLSEFFGGAVKNELT